MKKLLWALVIILFPIAAFAANVDNVNTVATANVDAVNSVSSANIDEINGVTFSPACTLEETIDDNGTNTYAICNAAAKVYVAFPWTAGKSYSQTQSVVYLTKISTPAMSLTAHTYDDDGGSPSDPDTSLASSNAIAPGSITSDADNTFTYTGSATITNTSKYWIVFQCSTWSSTDYFKVGYDSAGSDTFRYSSDGSTWNDSAETGYIRAKTYSGACP